MVRKILQSARIIPIFYVYKDFSHYVPLGIDDAMDLDIFDFDAPPDAFYNSKLPYTGTRLSDFGMSDQGSPFSDMQSKVQFGGGERPAFEDGSGQRQRPSMNAEGFPTSMTKLPSSVTGMEFYLFLDQPTFRPVGWCSQITFLSVCLCVSVSNLF